MSKSFNSLNYNPLHILWSYPSVSTSDREGIDITLLAHRKRHCPIDSSLLTGTGQSSRERSGYRTNLTWAIPGPPASNAEHLESIRSVYAEYVSLR